MHIVESYFSLLDYESQKIGEDGPEGVVLLVGLEVEPEGGGEVVPQAVLRGARILLAVVAHFVRIVAHTHSRLVQSGEAGHYVYHFVFVQPLDLDVFVVCAAHSYHHYLLPANQEDSSVGHSDPPRNFVHLYASPLWVVDCSDLEHVLVLEVGPLQQVHGVALCLLVDKSMGQCL